VGCAGMPRQTRGRPIRSVCNDGCNPLRHVAAPRQAPSQVDGLDVLARPDAAVAGDARDVLADLRQSSHPAVAIAQRGVRVASRSPAAAHCNVATHTL
jgi:hypothetical protein